MNFGMSFEEQMEHWRNALANKEDREALINYFSVISRDIARNEKANEDYEDLYSDLLITVIEAIDEWRPSETYPYLSMYVNLKVRHRYSQIVKKIEMKKKVLANDQLTEEFIFELNDKENAVFEKIENRIVAEQFWRLFKKYGNRLTTRERAYIMLYYGLGGLEPMSYTEIGKIFGVTKSVVGQIVHKAERKLSDWPRVWNCFGRECGYKLEITDIFEADSVT